MSTLGNHQRKFARMSVGFLSWVLEQGYEFTWGETLRGPAQIAHNVKTGKGIKVTLHALKCAMDINLFINGVYQTTTEAHRPLGEEWERRGGTWGGRFGDGNHYSLEWRGIK